MNCPHCTNGTWDGPRLVHYVNGIIFRGWPTVGPPPNHPLPEAFHYRCTCCGFSRYAVTVMYGGPVPDVAKPSKQPPPADD